MDPYVDLSVDPYVDLSVDPYVDPYVDIKRIFKKRRNLQVAFGEAFEDRVWNSFTGEWEKNTPKMLERSKKNGETRKAEISILYSK